MNSPKHIVVFVGRGDAPDFPKSSKLEWANPRGYVSPRDKSDAVYAPKNPKIEEDYRVAGKHVWRPENEAATQAPEPSIKPILKGSGDVASGQVEEVVDAPAESEGHWSELSWPKMRSLATEFTEDPVKSKDQAREILEQAESEGKV